MHPSCISKLPTRLPASALAEAQPWSPPARAPAGGVGQRACDEEEADDSHQPVCAAWTTAWGLFAKGCAQLRGNSGSAEFYGSVCWKEREIVWIPASKIM